MDKIERMHMYVINETTNLDTSLLWTYGLRSGFRCPIKRDFPCHFTMVNSLVRQVNYVTRLAIHK